MPGYIKPPSNQYIYSSSTVDGARIMTAASDYGLKNRIINGDFSVWQRGTSFTNPSVNAFFSDRWRQNKDGSGGTRVYSQQTLTPGTLVGFEGRYFMRYAQTSATTGTTYENFLIQPIEDVRTLSGQTATVSFWAKADAARTISVTLLQYFGTNGSGTAASGYPTVTLNTSWQRYFVVMTVPSVVGKTINDADAYSQLLFTLGSSNLVQTIDITGIQFELGPVATNFEQRPQQVELALCQRYFQSSFPIGTSPQNNIAPGIVYTQTANANVINGSMFQVPMRTAPSFTTYNPYANNALWRQANSATDITISAIYSNGNMGISYIATSGVTVTTSNSVHGHWAASAEL
jgi:hypothetical protein